MTDLVELNSLRNDNSDNAARLIDRAIEIERLAALALIDYEAAPADAAKRLGVRSTILDREVAKKRLSSWAGRMGVMCRSRFVGVRAMMSRRTNMRTN